MPSGRRPGRQTAIEWTDAVWNPVTGCDRVSPGCAHCYALELAPRLRRMGVEKYVTARDGGRASGPAFGVTLHDDVLEQPLRWGRPRRVFVNSMSDLFHEDVPDEYIAAVFGVMALAAEHTFQVLTKRPSRMLAWFRWYAAEIHDHEAGDAPADVAVRHLRGVIDPAYTWNECMASWPLPNVWLGVSIENRRFVGRADVLRETPAAVRFISAEPLLGPLTASGRSVSMTNATPDGSWSTPERQAFWGDGYRGPELDLTGIDWLIVGGESGASARRMDPDWARALLRAVRLDHDDVVGLGRPYDRFPRWSREGTAFFMKQLGGRHPGGALDELPPDLRIREFPVADRDPLTARRS